MSGAEFGRSMRLFFIAAKQQIYLFPKLGEKPNDELFRRIERSAVYSNQRYCESYSVHHQLFAVVRDEF